MKRLARATYRLAAMRNSTPLAFPLLLLVLALPFAAFSQVVAPPPAPATPVRQADAVCGNCHKDILKTYLDTPMANASGLAIDRVFTGSFHHAASGIDYKVFQEDGSLWLSYARLGDPDIQQKHRLEYFLGSGHLGLTYLYSLNGYFVESPVAYYANSQDFDMKPGLGNFPALPPSLPMNSGCMRCHMSDVQREDPGTLNHFSQLPFLHAGITCESCHGDTSRHVASAGKAPLVNPSKLDPQRRDSVCISCHMEGDTRIEHVGRNVLDYKPGDRITDYLSYFVYASDNISSRGVSEIEELAVSRCKRVSGDRMSCMNCHDPHYSPPPEKRAAFYRGKCLACHMQPQFASEHFSDNPDCTSCHMPKGKADKVPHIAWTDHRLRQRYGEASVKFDADPNLELVSFFKETTDPRDLALAYYDLVAGGNSAETPRAWALLLAAKDAHPQDFPVLSALGYLAQLRGKTQQGIDIYRDAAKLDPLDPTVANNLATLLAKSGQLKEAETLWEKTFALNQATDELGINLASVQCMLGKKDAAALTLTRVLFYSPDRKTARHKLRAIESGKETCRPRDIK
jgi:hypothetical protein